MASAESICARLCLLTCLDHKEKRPVPLSRATVSRMVHLGAIEGLALRSVSGIVQEHYDRAQALLSQASRIYAKLERYRAKGFDVLLPEDDNWPAGLRALGRQMPQYLFVKGNTDLFSCRTVAVAGSRKIAQETAAIAVQCGKAIAEAGLAMVCGGAQGVDAMAQHGVLNAGGSLIIVPALPAEELIREKYLSDALSGRRLLICCDTWPDEAFSAQKALSRNHTIYALGDAALVVASREGIGGSWRGASDCLRGGYAPVYTICSDHSDMKGNCALVDLGAKPCDIDKPIISQVLGEKKIIEIQERLK